MNLKNDLTIYEPTKLVFFAFPVLPQAYRQRSQGRHGSIDMLLGQRRWMNEVLGHGGHGGRADRGRRHERRRNDDAGWRRWRLPTPRDAELFVVGVRREEKGVARFVGTVVAVAVAAVDGRFFGIHDEEIIMMCIKISAIAEMMICFELYHTIQWLYFFSLKKLFLVLLMELVSEVLFLSTLLKRRHSRCRSSKKIVGESMKIVCESFFCFEPWL